MRKFFEKMRVFAYIRLKREMNFYYYNNFDNPENFSEFNKDDFEVVDNASDYLRFVDKYKIPPVSDYIKRFNHNARFAFSHNDECYLSQGWIMGKSNSFKIDYFKCKIPIYDNLVVLFGFYTNENERRKGHHKKLLTFFKFLSPNSFYLIYTAPTNIGAHKAIINVGYNFLGVYRRYEMWKVRRKIRKICRSIS